MYPYTIQLHVSSLHNTTTCILLTQYNYMYPPYTIQDICILQLVHLRRHSNTVMKMSPPVKKISL